jgi:deoxyribodipyrimidine photo-lyase
MTKTAIFLFHRDLRLEDNTALIKAAADGYEILPMFVFPPEQIDPKKNRYFSHNAVQFMTESLHDLDSQIKKKGGDGVMLLYGDQVAELKKLIGHVKGVSALYCNQDYTVYAKRRDADIQKMCEELGVSFQTEEDYGLVGIHEGLVENERPYMVLSQYYKYLQNHMEIRRPRPFHGKFSSVPSIPWRFAVGDMSNLYHKNPEVVVQGGRTHALKQMDAIKNLKDYGEKRDYPALPKTSLMSAFLKFGCVSVREMYWHTRDIFGKHHSLLRELVFRDFYMKIYGLKPELQRGRALHDRLDKAIPWRYDKKLFKAWCEGRTGFPIVDAGMRQLNTIGWQHNRVRMVTSNILTKYLLIDWRWGERYFAQQLVDYDPASNAMGWQWSSSVGPDAVPYFRAPFNPFTQSKKFDPDAEYIKRWVTELAEVDPKDIHKWGEEKVRAKYPGLSYPAPLVDQKEASRRAVEVYKEAYAKSKKT